MEYAIRNGKVIKKEEANISVYNKAFFFDFAVYITVKVIKGKPFFIESDAEKLLNSAKLIRLEHNFSKQDMVDWVKKLIEINKSEDALIRVVLIGAASEQEEPTMFLFPVGLTFYPKKFYSQGIKLITFKGERFMPQSKSIDLLLCFLAFREAQKQGASDALLIDRDGNIREGTRTSFYAIKENTLFAPPKEKVLEGVSRKLLLSVASKIMEVKEQDIPLEKIQEYDECFVTSTTMNVMPVREIDGQLLAEEIGEKTKHLQQLYKEELE